METTLVINNVPNADDLWAGIGGHFDNLGQIINEFLDNSISNFAGNRCETRNIIIRLKELEANGDVRISIEDSGTGIKMLNEAFSLGNRSVAESPLNEHGFGMKHALASANPGNDSWEIYTRTAEDVATHSYKKISSTYKIDGYEGAVITNERWPGKLNNTGTLVVFTCTREMYQTITRGLKGGIRAFRSIADVLCEDIGFVYAGVIQRGDASITIEVVDSNGNFFSRAIGALTPDWEDFIRPGSGTENVDLGGGDVTIEYKFGKINEKAKREEFDNSTARKYYQKNISSSGVEIRINGRVLCHNLFKEIWGIEKHNSYNYLLVMVDLKSEDNAALPKTRTSKNGLREGDIKLERLYEWIRSYLPVPDKDITLADHETDLFEKLRDNKMKFNPDPNKVIDTEMYVFTRTGNRKDKVRVDLYEKTMGKVTIYEGKRETTTSKDVYQLRMYWDGLVYDEIKPDFGVLVASEHPESVKNLISIVNTMSDAAGNNYNFSLKTWRDLGLDVGI